MKTETIIFLSLLFCATALEFRGIDAEGVWTAAVFYFLFFIASQYI